MSGTASNAKDKGKKAKVTQAVLMHDMDQPDKATLVAHDDEFDSEYEDMFDEELEKDWASVRYSDTIPKEDHVKKGKILEDEGRMKQNLPARLHYEVKKTATLVGQVSGFLIKAGVNIAAENISYYATRETAEALLKKIPAGSAAVATGLDDTITKVRRTFITPKRPDKVAELAATWSHPPSAHIKDPRDAPEGSNLDFITIIPEERRVKKVANLRKNDSDEGEMEDVPLGDSEEENGDEEWEDAVEEWGDA